MSRLDDQPDGLEDEPQPMSEAEIAREMRLRPEPPRVTRVSRKVLIGAGAVVALGLGGALIVALQSKYAKPPAEELYTTGRKSAAEGLAALPRDYSAIPKLGPPLPGDFARPMVDQAARAPISPSTTTAQPLAVDPVRQQRQQQRDAAIGASVFAGRASAGGAEVERVPPPPATGEPPAVANAQPPSAVERRTAFLAAPPDRKTTNSGVLEQLTSFHVIQAGSIIAAALVSGIHSDLPGQVIAQVTENVFDSPTGRTLLIPQGARLVGSYDSDVAAGQSRALVAWTRLIMPDGRSIVLDNMPAADAAGQAGLQDRTDYHWGGLLRAAAISTLLSVGAQSGSSGSADDLTRALREGASDSISRTGRQVVDRELGRPPTITIRQGYPVRVIVTRDIVIDG